MDISDSFTIDAPFDAVWEELRDAHSIAACFPGAQLLEQLDDASYLGQLTVRFGPTTVTFQGQAAITTDDHTHTGVIDARGRDGRGASVAAAQATVSVTGEEVTELSISGTIEVTGPLSGFASTGGTHVARALFEEFSKNVAERARARSAASAAGDPGGRARSTATVAGAPPAAPARPLSFTRLVWRSFQSFLRSVRSKRS